MLTPRALPAKQSAGPPRSNASFTCIARSGRAPLPSVPSAQQGRVPGEAGPPSRRAERLSAPLDRSVRRLLQRPQHIRHQVLGSSAPTEKRMKPSGTASPPHLPRRSAVDRTPPKLVASSTSRSAPRKRSACARVGQHEGNHTADSAASAAKRSRATGRRAAPDNAARSPRAAPRRASASSQRGGLLPVDAQVAAWRATGARARPPWARESRRRSCATVVRRGDRGVAAR